MSTLPIDVCDHMLTWADLGTVNALARSCSQLAQRVRVRAHELAAPHSARRYGDGIDWATRLPNGTMHGSCRLSLDDGNMIVEFDLGVATYWRHIDPAWGATWGCNGFPYMMDCGNIESIRRGCVARVEFASGMIVSVLTDGSAHYGMAEDVYTITATPVHGYMVDGSIATDVVGPWMDGVIETIKNSETFDQSTFDKPIPHIVYVESEDVIRVLDRISSLSTRQL